MLPNIYMGKYILRCPECRKELEDDFTNACGNHNALLRSVYRSRRLIPRNKPGLWKYIDWLPVKGYFDYDASPVTYRSRRLAKELGLKNLHISFSGYWPEREARMLTCTFKELEAPPTLQRATEHGVRKLVLASAGNTGRAFAHAMNFAGSLDIVIFLPESAFPLSLPSGVPDSVHIVSMKGDCDYSDAISYAGRLSALPGFTNEGGARNVARRDGMAVVMLDAALNMGRLPDHYFQAIGSGTGAIACFEASERLISDGRFGDELPAFHLSQNLPFTPMVNAWENGRSEIVPETDMQDADKSINQLYAYVLSNRNPPYSIKGGVFDALTQTSGKMYKVSRSEAVGAERLFESAEGIDIVPAAAVAAASIVKAVEERKVEENDCILLNITGGGEKRLAEDFTIHWIEPKLTVSKDEKPKEVIKDLGL